MRPGINRRPISLKIPSGIALSVLVCAINGAFAAEVTDLGTVSTQAQVGEVSSAAPAQASLHATQPQSTVSRAYIEDGKSPATDYTGIVAITPSATGGISPNGPGLGEAKNGLRGFKDGEYNVTFDGVPFGDTNGPTHHTTAYFPSEVIGGVSVERGPGNASNLGQATFGGSINLSSRELTQERTVSPYFSSGSWNTRLIGARVNSGTLGEAGDTKFGANVQKLSSDGYRTFSAVESENLMFKLQKSLGASTLLTINTNYNKNRYDQPDKDNGLTLAQVAQYGKNYVLSNNVNQADYYLYNRVDKSTELNYIRLQSELGSGWAIDNNSYYYNYTNNGLTADKSATPGTTYAATAVIPGYLKTNEYKVYGDIFKATKQMEAGLLRAGLWIERADTHRSQHRFNVRNMAVLNDQAAVPGLYTGLNDVTYEQNSGWNQYQPFVEFEWAASQNLTVVPGVKKMHTHLTIDALVNQTARIAQNVAKDFSATLPFLSANYKVDNSWSTYAQYAKGMLVPDISSYQSSNANATQIDPQTSTNLQLGVVHKSDRVSFDADVYSIDFNNKIATSPVLGTAAQPVYYNQGGVTYKGLEGQVAYAFERGFSVYANGSANSAKSKATSLQIAGVPDTTAAFGVMYKSGGWSGSFVNKRVGRTFALDDEGYKLDPYSTTDLSLAYTFDHPGLSVKTLKLQGGIYNLANNQAIVTVKPKNTTAGATYGVVNAGDTFQFQPTRSFMLTARADF